MADENASPPNDGLVVELTEKLQVPVLNARGESAGSVEIDPAEFGGKISRQLLHDAALMYEANGRAGTHSTLRRGEVAGSTKKLFRQKGTGNARVGNRRTNKRRGGGTAKGPKPRDYEYHLPKKALRAATRMALLSKFRDHEAVVVDDFALTGDGPKTKQVAAVLKACKLDGQSCLIGTAGLDRRLYLSARNIDGVEILPATEFNSYVVLRQKRLVLTRSALDVLRKPQAVEQPAAATA
jgi:large subunit ribosomal protein L4